MCCIQYFGHTILLLKNKVFCQIQYLYSAEILMAFLNILENDEMSGRVLENWHFLTIEVVMKLIARLNNGQLLFPYIQTQWFIIIKFKNGVFNIPEGKDIYTPVCV